MKFKYILFFFILSVVSKGLLSQDKTIDSLLHVLNKKAIDTVSAKTYLKITGAYMNKGQFDSGYKYVNKGYSISKQLRYIKGMAVSCNYLGQVYNYKGTMDSAIFYFTESMKHYKTLKDTVRESGMINNIGVVYKTHGYISKALDCYFQSLKIKEKQKDTVGIANAYTNIGHLYSESNDTANTIKYHLKALELRKLSQDAWGVGNSLMAIGLFYTNVEKYDLGISYLKESLRINEELEDEESISITCYNLANIYYKQKKLEDAIKLYNRALELSRKNNNKEGIATCLQVLAQISFEKGDKKLTLKLLEEAYENANEVQVVELLGNVSEKLSEVYESVGDFKNAFKFHKIATSIKDSLFNQENVRKLTSEGLKYEHDKEKIILEKEQEKKEAIAKSESFKKDLIIYASVLFLIVVSVFSFIIFNRLKENKKQKNIIEQQRNEMIDSINYAKRIQFALLAHQDLLNANLPEHFVFFKPKDIVSGDFYWATKKDGYFYLAVCDSTGHGVPGAFMSLLNISFLNEAINEKNITSPHEVLNHVRTRLIENIDGAQDGMDGILLKFKIPKSNEHISFMEYAAAHNAPILVRHSEIQTLGKDKMPVGKGEHLNSFTLQSIQLEKGDTLYLYTDGYADQFGGPKGKKFKYKSLNQLLLSNVNNTMLKQKEVLDSTIHNWQGNLEQVDDVCVLGIKI